MARMIYGPALRAGTGPLEMGSARRDAAGAWEETSSRKRPYSGEKMARSYRSLVFMDESWSQRPANVWVPAMPQRVWKRASSLAS